jgi:two-component system LytT family response regulator
MATPFYKTIIIEDQKAHAQILTTSLAKHFPKIQIIATCPDLTTAELQIRKHQPHFIFLDINLGNENGFDLLEEIKDLSLHVIVVTAYTEYLIQAHRTSAIEILHKPYTDPQIITAVSNTITEIESAQPTPTVQAQQQQIVDAISYSVLIKDKISLPTEKKTYLIPLSQIMYFESTGAKGNYTRFHLTPAYQQFIGNNEMVITSHSSKKYEELLEPFHFVRITKGQVVSLNHIKHLFGKSCDFELNEIKGKKFAVDPSHRAHFRQCFDDYTLGL